VQQDLHHVQLHVHPQVLKEVLIQDQLKAEVLTIVLRQEHRQEIIVLRQEVVRVIQEVLECLHVVVVLLVGVLQVEVQQQEAVVVQVEVLVKVEDNYMK